MSEKNMRRLVLGLTLGFFFLACFTPIIDIRSEQSTHLANFWWGWQALILGWLAILVGQFAWLANPFLAVAFFLVAARKYRAAFILAVMALLLSLDFLTLVGGQKIPADESGSNNMVLHGVMIGTYFWFLSILGTVAGSVLLFMRTRSGVRGPSTSKSPATPPA